MQGLKYISWADQTGYGIAGMSYVRAFHNIKVPLTWTPLLIQKGKGAGYQPVAGQKFGPPPLNQLCNSEILYDRVIVHTVPEYYPYWCQQEAASSRQLWGYTVWETDQLPEHWIALLNRMDGLFVPTEWNRQLFQDNGVTTRIEIAPHLPQYNGQPPEGIAGMTALDWLGKRFSQPDKVKPFIFYTVGMWTPRKGLELLLQTYWKTFQADDPVLLVIKTSQYDFSSLRRSWKSAWRRTNPSVEDTVRSLAQSYGRTAPVSVLTQPLTSVEMQALHTLGDCYISLSRAEGWGLGAYEAAWFGKPIIATNLPGHRAFLRPDLAWLVDCQPRQIQENRQWSSYTANQHWHEPELEQAASFMRQIFNDQKTANSKGQALKDFQKEEFGPTKIVGKMLKAISEG